VEDIFLVFKAEPRSFNLEYLPIEQSKISIGKSGFLKKKFRELV